VTSSFDPSSFEMIGSISRGVGRCWLVYYVDEQTGFEEHEAFSSWADARRSFREDRAGERGYFEITSDGRYTTAYVKRTPTEGEPG
jgi:hypothetical protein